MSTELRIKLEHIGMEPSIIRKHEARIKRKLNYLKNKGSNESHEDLTWQRMKLAHHRRWDVRNEIRATGLALAFINNKPYSMLEKNVREPYKRKYYIVPKVLRMVKKYHSAYQNIEDKTILNDIEIWMNT